MSETEPKIKSWQYILSFIWETVKIIAISLAIIIPVRYFLFQPFIVRGASMQPNFEHGEYLIIDEISYRFHQPERGDVIVFRYPKYPSQYYIKRIVALPNEIIKIEDGEVMIFNKDDPGGFILDEPYLSRDNEFTSGNLEIELDEDDYFVLGDNRKASSDSRKWGTVPRKYVIGHAWLRAWPIDRLGVVD